MAKLYDIVETSKMSAEYDGSLIVGDCGARQPLENGRLVVADEVGKVADYPADITDKVLLNASVEKMYEEFRGLTEFRVEQDDMPRLEGFRVGDKFKTTAIDYSGDRATFDAIVVGDKVVTHVEDGKFTVLLQATVTTSSFVADVIEKTYLGFEKYPAIKVKVTKTL